MTEQVFIRVENLEEALAEKAAWGHKARILAGGSDLMVQINSLVAAPERLVYIGGAGLSYFKETEEGLEIGAATTLSEVCEAEVVQRRAPVLAQAVGQMASWAIRNKATLGGNLANASPAADTAPALLALDAVLNLTSLGGRRQIPVGEFFIGPGKTAMLPEEILESVWIPYQPRRVTAYKKIGRRKAETLSVVAVCVAYEEAEGRVKRVRIALGASAPVPMLAQKAQAFLEGKSLDRKTLEEVGRLAAQEAKPIDDQRASAWYRRKLIAVLVPGLFDQNER